MGVAFRNIGEVITGNYVSASNTSGAAATTVADSPNNNVAVTGATVNRLVSAANIAKSLTIYIPYLASLSENETVSFTVKTKDSADASTFGNETTIQAAAVFATGESGGSNETGLIELNVSLANYRQYVQVNVTPNLSQLDVADDDGGGPHTDVPATDAAVWACMVVLGGFTITTV